MQPKAKVIRSEAEWKAMLSPEQFRILREHGTERAFTGPHLEEKRLGTYSCAACHTPLFRSNTKFESGCGWPSFFATLTPDTVIELEDRSYGMRRVEIRCGTCEGHLGHVFPDGPKPTGLRYCMNGHALTFKADQDT